MKGGSKSEKFSRRSNHTRGVLLKINYKSFIVLFCFFQYICLVVTVFLYSAWTFGGVCVWGDVTLLNATDQGEGGLKITDFSGRPL